jgi:hypothetical protein
MKYKYLDINDSIIEDIEEVWDVINEEFYAELNIGKDDAPSADNPLASLAFDLEFGIYPQPEVLLQIADTYKEYIHRKGSVSLEDIFFGKPVKGVGNYAARKAKMEDAAFLNVMVQCEELLIDSSKKRTQIEIAEEYLIKKGSEEDPEHLLRKMRRLRSKMK